MKGRVTFLKSIHEVYLLPRFDILLQEAELASSRKNSLNEKIFETKNIIQEKNNSIYSSESKTDQKIKNKKHSASDKKDKLQIVFVLTIDESKRLLDTLISSGCFLPEDRTELLNLIHGKRKSFVGKLTARGLQKRYSTLVYELMKALKITSSKKETAFWIQDNFRYQKDENSSPINYSIHSLNDTFNDSKPKKRLHKDDSQYINIEEILNN